MTVPAVRVLLVEDNEVYRGTLELLLAQEEGIVVVAGVGDVAAAVAQLDGVPPDVVVLDLRLPGLAGADAVEALAAAAPSVRVLCLTAEATPALAAAPSTTQAMKASGRASRSAHSTGTPCSTSPMALSRVAMP